MNTDAATTTMPEKKAEAVPAEIIQHEFADVDRFHLAKGLFQIMGGARKPDPVEIKLHLSNGGYLEIVSPRPLRPYDQKLLCTVLCKAAQNKKIISPDTQNKIGRLLRDQLELLEAAAEEKCLAYQTSARQLTEDMGCKWHGARTVKQIEASLKRLFMTSFTLETYTKEGRRKLYLFRLMSHVKLEEARDITLAFGLNVILAAALLTPGHYARIDMEILRGLEQAQQLMFVALCNAIDPGKKRSFTVEELAELIYGEKPDKILRNTYIKQLSRAKTLTETLVDSLSGWSHEEKGDLIWIKRPFLHSQKPRRTSKKKRQKLPA